jgi:endo-1,3(4)-beta-glucanase
MGDGKEKGKGKWKEKGKGKGTPDVDGGWRGILFANLALVDAKAAYAFFKEGVNGVWDERWVDGGATRSWYLVWCAALGGVAMK